MTGADPQPGTTARGREDGAAPSACEDTSAAESTPAEGAAATGVGTPRSLTSLTSLVGDGLAGGSTCTADGVCD